MVIKNKKENWRNKVFLFLFSQSVSTLGSSVVSFSIFWYLTLEYSSGFIITALVLCIFIPQIIISIFAGVWADKYNKKYIIIAADSFIALATFAIAVFILAGNTSLYMIYGATVIRSIGSGIQNPAISAILPQITPKEYFTRVNGINNTISASISLLSPAIGGILLGSYGIVYSLMFDVITAIIGVGILSFMNISLNTGNKENEKTESEFTQLKSGLKYIKNNSVISQMLKYYTIIYIIVTPIAFLFPLKITRIFGKDMWKVTLTEIFWASGMIIGGFIITFTKNIKNKIILSLFINFILGIDFFLLGATSNFYMILATLVIGGIFMIIGDTAETSFLQENTDLNMMGRVFAMIHMIRAIIFPISILFFGPLADIIKIEYLLCGTSILLSFLAIIKFYDKKFINLGKNRKITE